MRGREEGRERTLLFLFKFPILFPYVERERAMSSLKTNEARAN